MPKTRHGRSQWVALLAGPLLALISFVAAYYVNPLSFGDRTPLASIPAFLLAIVILLISHNLATFREIERASAFSDRIYEAVKDYLHVTKVGSPEAAFQYVVGRLPILQDVRNTTLNLPEELERADEKFYETTVYAEVGRRIAEWTGKGLRWKDIGDARATTRLRAIHAAADRAASRRKTGYQYRLLVRNEPQINFILLSYSDGSTEALFNWDFRNIGQDPVVLLSRDRDIVEMFAVQFEHLWRASSPDHDNSATRSTSEK
jgi:hypothetical protein